MGFDRTSTFNLNIRYGKMPLALLARAVTYEFREKLPKPYNRWNSKILGRSNVHKNGWGYQDEDDFIIVTNYKKPPNNGWL